jgi:hypothetical protein
LSKQLPKGYRLVDLGGRIELRAESPDPSVPTGGRLIGYAESNDSGWVVDFREHGGSSYKGDVSRQEVVDFLLHGARSINRVAQLRKQVDRTREMFGLDGPCIH